MKYFLGILILALLALAGCKKLDVEPPPEADPVFSVSAVIDGMGKNWIAGVDDYYLFTGFEQDTTGLFTFWGRMEKEPCSNVACGEKIAFYFDDLAPSPSGQTDIMAALFPGNHPYQHPGGLDTIWTFDTTTSYLLTLDASPSLTSPNEVPFFSWSLPNANPMAGSQVSITFAQAPQNMPVTLTMLSGIDSCFSSQTQSIFMLSPVQPSPCQVFMDTVTNPGTPFPTALKAVVLGQAPFNYQWSNGSAQAVFPLNNVSPSIPIEVSVTDATGCQAVATGQTPTQSGTFCSARFNWSLSTQMVIDSSSSVVSQPFQPGGVRVVYTDAAGMEWSSAMGPQLAANAGFQILSVESFDENENGQKTVKLNVKFQAMLWNQNGQFLNLTDGAGVIAVAYP
ncbi:MAG: hypothetical protein Kow0027_03680 [Saprospiraceae bacterium]